MPIIAEPIVNNHLRQFRLARGLVQYELSVKASVSATILRAIERYDYRPGAKVRQRIARVLQVSEEEIWPKDAAAGDEEE